MPDTAKLVIDPDSVTVAEGGTTTFNVSLDTALTQDGVVQIAVANSAVATISPAVITFTAGETASKTITVTGVEDNNLANEMTEIVASGTDLSPITVPVTVTDDDKQALVLTTNAASITEGDTATFGVHLAFKPTGDTAVTLTSADPARLTAAPASLTFTPANFETDQTVTLTSLTDVDVAVNTVVVTAASAGLVDSTVTVTIADRDLQGISTTPASLALTEGGTPGTFQVKLTQAPSANVTITVASSKIAAATVSPATLTFTPTDFGTGTAHVVTVTPVQDTNTTAETLNVTLNGGGLTASVPVTVADDDVQAIVASSPITVAEGATTLLPVKLAFDPGASVTVTVASADATIAGAAPTTLTFDSTNFSTVQNVTVTGTQDTDLANETTTLTLSSTGLVSTPVTVNVTDDDVQRISLAPDSNALTLPEGTDPTPSTSVVGVTLGFQPAAATTIAVASSNANLTVNGAATATLSFTTANWNVPQNVTLRALDETNLTDETANVTFTTAAVPVRTLVVTIPDTDVQSFLVTPATLPALTEGGTATFTVKLNFAPTANVVATVASSNSNVLVNGSASATITITPGNTATTITLTALEDADATNDTSTITITDNATVAPIVPTRTLNANVTDNDTMSFVISPVTSNADANRLEVTEEGPSVFFNVHLSAAPTANATVTFTPSSTNVVELSTNNTTFAPATTFVFTAANFAVDQRIYVRGLADPNLVDEVFTVDVHGPTQLAAPDAQVFMRKIENDAQAIVTTPAQPGPITVTEGAPQTLAISLQFQPVSSVQVTVTPSNANIVVNGSTAPITLLFTTTNYNVPQNVAVTTPDDNDQVDAVGGTIVVSAPALPSRTLNVNLVDDDDQAIVLTQTSGSINETPTTPDSTTFDVKLAFKPTASVETITVAVPSAGSAKVDVCNPSTTCSNTITLTFSDQTGMAGGWDTAQTVTVRSESDVDVNNETVAIALSSDIAPTTTATYTVTVVDDDQLNAVIAQGHDQTICESTTGPCTTSFAFTMRLNFNPTTPITIDLASNDTGAVTVSPASLTFDSTNYATTQNFTVTSVQDVDLANETATVTASNATTRIPNVDLTIHVTDDDQQAFVNTGSLQITEGTSGNLSVALAFKPAANVTVSVAYTVAPETTLAADQTLALSTATLTFTPTNYATAQIVTVAAGEDDDLDHYHGDLDLTATSTQSARETPAAAVATYAVHDNDNQAIVIASSPAVLVNSALESGPYVQFLVKLAARPRLGLTDTVHLVAPANVEFYPSGTTLDVTFDESDFGTAKPVFWRVIDTGTGSNANATASITATMVGEATDQAAPFLPDNTNDTKAQAIRKIDDDEQQIIQAVNDPTGFNGATQFTQRSNIAFAPNGTAEGLVAFTARSTPTGGVGLLGFTNRALVTPTAGPQFATGGQDPTTEIVQYNEDGTGSFDVFSSSATGIVFARFALDGTAIASSVLVAPAGDNATDFSVTRNGSVYGVVYRREATGRNNLYFRAVEIATGTVSAEQPVTTADSFVHFHPTLLNVSVNTPTFNSIVAPYIVMYTENGTQRAARLTVTGALVASTTLSTTDFPGTNFMSSIVSYDPFNGLDHIFAASVRSTDTNIGDNAVFLYVLHINTVGQVVTIHTGQTRQLTSGEDLAPVSPPYITSNIQRMPNGTALGDIAVAYDSGLLGVNQVGVALFSMAKGARELRLDGVGDEGLYPSITWALDRWVLRYQSNNATAPGIRLRSGSFEGDAP